MSDKIKHYQVVTFESKMAALKEKTKQSTTMGAISEAIDMVLEGRYT